MKLENVESSTLQAVGHDLATGLMAVQFKNGGLYLYHGVPARVKEEFDTAESKGSFFAHNIKPKYFTTKIELATPSTVTE